MVKELENAVPIELEELKDLARMVASVVRGFAEHTAHLFVYKRNDEFIYGSITIVPGYYDLRGLPMLVYVRTKEEPKGSFIRYRTTPKEEIGFSSETTDTTYFYVPLVRIKKVPGFLKLSEQKSRK